VNRIFAPSRVSNVSAPTWFTALGHKQWAQPVTNTIQDVLDPLANIANASGGNHGNSGPSSIITSWVGAICDQSTGEIGLGGNGGHMDYLGNEVYSVGMRTNSPVWVRRRNATASPLADSAPHPQWSDGRPCSDHTGDYCVAANGKWLKCGLGAGNFDNCILENYWWSYDPSVDDWTYLGNGYATNPDGYGISSSTVYDASRDQIIKCIASPSSATCVRMYSVSTCAQVDSVPVTLTAGTVSAALDSTNDVLLVRVYGSATCYAIDLSTKVVATFSASGTGPTDQTAKLHWHAPSGAFVTWDGAQGLLKLTPTVSGGNYTGAAWSSVAGGGGVTLPSNMGAALSGGMYSKVQLINDMGNGDAALVIVPRWSSVSDVWAMRLIGAV
jgi:hypothetical protein